MTWTHPAHTPAWVHMLPSTVAAGKQGHVWRSYPPFAEAGVLQKHVIIYREVRRRASVDRDVELDHWLVSFWDAGVFRVKICCHQRVSTGIRRAVVDFLGIIGERLLFQRAVQGTWHGK